MDLDSENKDADGKHLDILDQTLMRVSRGELTRVIVTMPPRHGKSERVSKKFPAWHVGRNPDDEIIVSSYSLSLARDFSIIARDTLKERGKRIFGNELSSNKQAGESWGIEGHRGGVNAAGVGGPITGKGARIAIIDDPFKNHEEANSEVTRETVWNWYTTTLYTRLTPDGRIIIVMTRWHEDDLVGRLLKKEADEIREGTHIGEKWTVINFPAIAEGDDYLGRNEGDPLWPEFGFNKDKLLQIKADVGSYVFNALYQQRPSAAGGTIFKRTHFRYFREETIHNQTYFIAGEKRFKKLDCWVFQTVDTANSEKTINDYFAVSTWYVTPDQDLLWYEAYRTHITGPDQKPLMKEQNYRYRPRFQAVEDKTFGTNLIQEMDKVTRSLVIAARYEVGKVYHRENMINLTDVEDELLSFPRGKNDDMVDTASMAGETVHVVWHSQEEDDGRKVDRRKAEFERDEDEPAVSTFW
jgi:hypothetical protein